MEMPTIPTPRRSEARRRHGRRGGDGQQEKEGETVAARSSGAGVATTAATSSAAAAEATNRTEDEDGEEENNDSSRCASSSPPASASAAWSTENNPLLRSQSSFLRSIPRSVRDDFFSDSAVGPERRAEIWADQAQLGEELVNDYAWATPDARAVEIVRAFSGPGGVVEIGSGRNAYWANVLASAGIDVVAYDADPDGGGGRIDAASQRASGSRSGEEGKGEKGGGGRRLVPRKGGPEVLSKEAASGRTLFLCYPDEEGLCDGDAEGGDDQDDDGEGGAERRISGHHSSLGSACMDHFAGEHVIHVGELYGDALCVDQAPWGRSSSPEFQQRLSSEFHCLIRVRLEGNWLHVRDTISVWKRTERCSMVFRGDGEDDGEGEDEDEEVEYRHVPTEERLPVDVAAPCAAWLLNRPAEAKDPSKSEPVVGKKRRVTGQAMDSMRAG